MLKFSVATHSVVQRSIEEAISEVDRELKVRYRCYEKWVREGKLSDVDARDRVDRLESAIDYLTAAAQRCAQPSSPVVLPPPAAIAQELIDDSHRRALEA